MLIVDKLFGWEQLFMGCTGVLSCVAIAGLNAAGTRPSLQLDIAVIGRRIYDAVCLGSLIFHVLQGLQVYTMSQKHPRLL